MRDAMRSSPPDFYSQIISRASQNISTFSHEFQEQTLKLEGKHQISERKSEMLNVIELSAHSTDTQLKEVSKIRDWLDSLDRDQQLYDDISNGPKFLTNSPYSSVERLIREDKKQLEERNLDKKQSKKKSFEKVIQNERINLFKASYTKSVITLSKDLLIMQKEIQEAMKPENILKKESSTAIRLQNLREKLQIELKNRRETSKLLKKDIKEADKLFNNNVEYHQKLEADMQKLDNFLSVFQSKSSIELIEKAKKNRFIKDQWDQKEKELKTQIRELNQEISKYQNKDQTHSEITNMNYANNLEIEKTKKNYEDIILSINQDMKLSDYYQMNSLQILEKELINTLNYHRGIESKNTQKQIKLATTSFTRLFMKYSKENQACFNIIEKVLRKDNVSVEVSIESLNDFKEQIISILNNSMNMLLFELNQIINNYGIVFADKFNYNDRMMKLSAKNQLDVLVGRKQRLTSQILNRETDIKLNQSTLNTMEGVYFDILQSFLSNTISNGDGRSNEIKNEILNINSFIQKVSSLNKETSEKLKNDLKKCKNKSSNLKRSSSMIISCKKFKLNQAKNESQNDDDDSFVIQNSSSSSSQPLDQPPKEPPSIKTIKTDTFQDENKLNLNLNNDDIQIKPLPPKSEPHSPRFSSSQKVKLSIESESKAHSSFEQVLVNKKKFQKSDNIRNIIKDNSPHFIERKKRQPRREKSRAEIEDARRNGIMKSHEKSKRTIKDIPKTPIIKNVDPKIINEIDSVYSFSSDSNKKNKPFKKDDRTKIQKPNSNDIDTYRKSYNDDEFWCIKNNINVTKKNISELPFSKRKVSAKQDQKSIYPFILQNNNSTNDISILKNNPKNSIKKSVKVNIHSNVFNFSEMVIDKKTEKNELFLRYFETKEPILTIGHEDHQNTDQSMKLLRASLDLKNRNTENLFRVKNSKNKTLIREDKFKANGFKYCYDNKLFV